MRTRPPALRTLPSSTCVTFMLPMKRDLSQFEVREVHEVIDESTQTLGVLMDHLEERTSMLLILQSSFQKSLQVPPDRCQGSPQLMGDIRHELGAHHFQTSQFGHIMQHQHGACCLRPALQGRGMHLKYPLHRSKDLKLLPGKRPLLTRSIQKIEQFLVADHFKKRSADGRV